MKKRKVCVVINSRANYARIKSFLIESKKNKNLDVSIILGASAVLHRFGSIQKQIYADGFKSAFIINTIVEGDEPINMAKSTALGLIELCNVFKILKPNVVLVIGDRFENLAVAIAASYMNICVAHTQGGEVTGSIDESVRHAITKLSHIHFSTSRRSQKFLINMGENKKKIFLTGCPSIDLIKKKTHLKKSILEKGVGSELDIKKKFIIILFHPVTTEYTNTNTQIDKLINAIKIISKKTTYQFIWLWPNIDSGSEKISSKMRIFREYNKEIKLRFMINFSPEDYLSLLNNSSCLVGNSSSGIRECGYLGIPVVNIGSRQANREQDKNVLNVKHEVKEIVSAVLKQSKKKRFKSSRIYGTGNAGKKISNILVKVDLSIKKKLNYLK